MVEKPGILQYTSTCLPRCLPKPGRPSPGPSGLVCHLTALELTHLSTPCERRHSCTERRYGASPTLHITRLPAGSHLHRIQSHHPGLAICLWQSFLAGSGAGLVLFGTLHSLLLPLLTRLEVGLPGMGHGGCHHLPSRNFTHHMFGRSPIHHCHLPCPWRRSGHNPQPLFVGPSLPLPILGRKY